jgi:sodium-coupled neutral amino acid transporter 2
VCACLVFGPALEPDVLNNMSATEMAPVVGALAARLISDTVRVGFATALVGSFVLLMYPMRATLAEVFCSGGGGGRGGGQAGQVPAAVFYPLTYGLVALVYLTAVFVPSIWAALSIVGSTASTLQGFLFPALLVLVLEPSAKPRHWARKGAAVLIAALGVGLFVNGFLVLLFPGEQRSEEGGARQSLWALW